MGEYARSLAIAHACISRWPQAQVHFLLSRLAPYAAGVPFPFTLLESSPTFHSKAVIDLIEDFRPTLVLFDNAGRTAQLQAARRSGARVVYISSRTRQRRKAFRWRWLRLLDEHWIAYPEFIAGSLSFFERLKLKMHPDTQIRYLDVILARGGAADGRPVPFAAGSFVLMVPGGGTGHPNAPDAIAQFQLAARGLAAKGIATFLVGAADTASSDAHLKMVGSLPQPQLIRLLREAGLVITNGGSTLLQAIACGAACVAVPIAGDQGARIQLCVDAEVAVQTPLDANSMLAAAVKLWGDETRRKALAQRARDLKLADGLDVAMVGLERLVVLGTQSAVR